MLQWKIHQNLLRNLDRSDEKNIPFYDRHTHALNCTYAPFAITALEFAHILFSGIINLH